MFATCCQTAAALVNACTQAAVENLPFRVWNRLLGIPPMLVPSGTKLYVIRLP
jgi:hypothetical protein